MWKDRSGEGSEWRELALAMEECAPKSQARFWRFICLGRRVSGWSGHYRVSCTRCALLWWVAGRGYCKLDGHPLIVFTCWASPVFHVCAVVVRAALFVFFLLFLARWLRGIAVTAR